MSTKLQLTNEYGTITIETNEDVDGCDNFINHLVRPVLKAVGYLDYTVNQYIGDFQEVSQKQPNSLSDSFREYMDSKHGSGYGDGGIASSVDYVDPYDNIYGEKDEDGFIQTVAYGSPDARFGECSPIIEGAPYKDPYDCPLPADKTKKKAVKKTKKKKGKKK